MRPFDRHRATVLAWFPPVLTAARERGFGESVTRLTAAEGRLRDGKLTAVVCGEFKRGKSSLLNTLLEEGEPFLFPVDTMFATSIVSTVTYGPKEGVVATLDLGDGRTERRDISRAEITEYVTESANPHNAKKARLLSITVPNPRLESGLSLVDTPGVGGVYAEHTAVTMGFLPTADAIVFVADATQPLAESELAFLRKAAAAAKVTDDEDALLFVLTKVDAVDYESILRNTRAKLADVTGRPEGAVTITPVSAHAKDAYLDGGDDEDLELSNFPELEDRIWAALSRRRTRLLLGGALTELDASAVALLRPLEAESAALAAEAPAKVAALHADAERREAEFTRLADGDATWREDLRLKLNDVGRELKKTARTRMDGIWDRVHGEYLYQDRYLDDTDSLVEVIGQESATVVWEISTLAGRRAAALQQQLADNSGLAIERRRFGDLPAPSVAGVEVTGRLEESADNGLRRVRDTSFGSGLGVTIGSILGNLVAPGIGGWIGAGIGALFGGGVAYGASEEIGRKQDLKVRRQNIKTELAPLRREQLRDVEDAIDRLMSAFRSAVTAELRSRLREGKQSAKDEAARLKAAGAATKQAADKRQAELGGEIAPLKRLRSEIEGMARRIAEPESSRTAPEPKAAMASDTDDWADE